MILMSSWLEQIFSADQVRRGGVVRRARYDVEHFVSLAELIDEARERGFHVIETGDQVIVICNQEGILIHC